MAHFGGDQLPPPVAPPEPFPNPTIRRGILRKMKIATNPQQIESRTILESAGGSFYEVGTVLKKAIFGQVVHAILLARTEGGEVLSRTQREMAIKVFSKRMLRQMQGRVQENPLAEITAMQFIGTNHPNIMGQIECCTDDENIYSIMPYLSGGELFDYVDEHGPLPPLQARDMFRQLLSGVRHLHSLGIGHRDMSLENVLVGDVADGERKAYVIIDFGMCLKLHYSASRERFCYLNRQSICGKKNYIPPEVLREEEVFSPLLGDIWAMGIILFIALTGVPPMEMASCADERFNMVSRGRLGEMLRTWGIDLEEGAVDLMQKILRPVPDERLTIDQIFSHPWMQEEGDGKMDI